ncbi:MAG: class I SAM-dependent methyltransferase [Rhodospirillales bacterium]
MASTSRRRCWHWRARAAASIDDPAVTIRFTEGDLTDGLPFETHSFDITLCLYGVLNHLPVAAHDRVAAELSRVTDGALFVTVRTVGSLPTIYVDLARTCALVPSA